MGKSLFGNVANIADGKLVRQEGKSGNVCNLGDLTASDYADAEDAFRVVGSHVADMVGMLHIWVILTQVLVD